jgi:hypothetical protein
MRQASPRAARHAPRATRQSHLRHAPRCCCQCCTQGMAPSAFVELSGEAARLHRQLVGADDASDAAVRTAVGAAESALSEAAAEHRKAVAAAELAEKLWRRVVPAGAPSGGPGGPGGPATSEGAARLRRWEQLCDLLQCAQARRASGAEAEASARTALDAVRAVEVAISTAFATVTTAVLEARSQVRRHVSHGLELEDWTRRSMSAWVTWTDNAKKKVSIEHRASSIEHRKHRASLHRCSLTPPNAMRRSDPPPRSRRRHPPSVRRSHPSHPTQARELGRARCRCRCRCRGSRCRGQCRGRVRGQLRLEHRRPCRRPCSCSPSSQSPLRWVGQTRFPRSLSCTALALFCAAAAVRCCCCALCAVRCALCAVRCALCAAAVRCCALRFFEHPTLRSPTGTGTGTGTGSASAPSYRG